MIFIKSVWLKTGITRYWSRKCRSEFYVKTENGCSTLSNTKNVSTGSLILRSPKEEFVVNGLKSACAMYKIYWFPLATTNLLIGVSTSPRGSCCHPTPGATPFCPKRSLFNVPFTLVGEFHRYSNHCALFLIPVQIIQVKEARRTF